jgi:hypothetical protein
VINVKIYDSDIRKVLYRNFTTIDEFITDTSTKVIDEMDICFGSSRVDIAIINGKLHGYEIKSGQDTLERLPSQIEAYNKVFDTMTIVTCENHINKVIEMVPKWWGIYYISNSKNGLILKRKRKVKVNTEIDSISLAQLLWRVELLELLSSNGIEKGTKSKTRFALCNLAAQNIALENIKSFVREKLKSRESWRAVPLRQLCDDLH